MNSVTFPCTGCNSIVSVTVTDDGCDIISKPCSCMMRLSEVDRMAREVFEDRLDTLAMEAAQREREDMEEIMAATFSR